MTFKQKKQDRIRRDFMKQIIYALEDDYGMHARPASQLAEVSKNYRSSMEIKYKEKTGDLKV